MKRKPRAALRMCLVVAVLAGCGDKKDSTAVVPATRVSSSAAASTSPSASPNEPIVLGTHGALLVTYVPVAPTEADLEAAKARAKAALPDVKIAEVPREAKAPFVHFGLANGAELDPISPSTLQLFAHGLDDAAKSAARSAKGALAAIWVFDADPDHARMKAALTIARDTAKALHGFVWDDNTRILYTPEAFDSERIASWQGSVPDMRRQFVQHYYETDGRHRAVTLGMQCFGQPDLVVQDLPVPLSGAVGDLVNVVAQVLVEGGRPAPNGDLAIDVSKLRHEGVKKAFASPKGAPIVVRLLTAKPEEGDAENALWALTFPGFDAPTEPERQGLACGRLFGKEPEELLGANADDAELAAITKRVQALLPALAKRFRAGVPVGARFMVKAPFDTDDKNVEWMWLDVTSWTDDAEIKGTLGNEPARIAGLHRGAPVSVKTSSVADYVWVDEKGKREGGESSEVLDKRR